MKHPHYARYFFISQLSARQQWIYKGEMATRTISTILFLSIFVALWTTAYTVNPKDEMVGYTLPQILWYLAMTETVALSTSRIFMEISDSV
ncbi:MAG: hypothetical protein P1S60_10730, partial [Anaerolineae bacterium]|nr:hypothetical protein [Anaerolineae bacterium]